MIRHPGICLELGVSGGKMYVPVFSVIGNLFIRC